MSFIRPSRTAFRVGVLGGALALGAFVFACGSDDPVAEETDSGVDGGGNVDATTGGDGSAGTDSSSGDDTGTAETGAGDTGLVDAGPDTAPKVFCNLAAAMASITDSGADADANVAPQVFTSTMAGCPGKVAWNERNTLCAQGCSACGAEQWVDGGADAAPTHHYWTNDQLRWSGTFNPTGPTVACTATYDAGSVCNPSGGPDSGPRPMRVCTFEPDAAVAYYAKDPLLNDCTWSRCGFGGATTNQYFGGCETNPTAGSLCCCPP